MGIQIALALDQQAPSKQKWGSKVPYFFVSTIKNNIDLHIIMVYCKYNDRRSDILKDKFNYLSTGDNEHPTPDWLYNKINDIFNFDIDLACSQENAKCKKYYTKQDNSLTKEWNDNSCWINPPYSKDLQPLFIKKAYESQSEYNNTIVLLIPFRPDTKIWHDYIFGKADIYIFRGRPRFYSDKGPTYPSALVVYSSNKKKNVYTVTKEFENVKLIY